MPAFKYSYQNRSAELRREREATEKKRLDKWRAEVARSRKSKGWD